MSNLDDIYAMLGIPKMNDPIADAIALVANGKLAEAQRAAADRLAEQEHADRLAALRARAESDPHSMTLKELGDIDRADKLAAREDQAAAARDYNDRRSAARVSTGSGELAEERYRSAYADWIYNNGPGHGTPAPRMEDFND